MGIKNRGENNMIINYVNKTVTIKIVYYGPAMCGKTTSLKQLLSIHGVDRIASIETTTGRTLFFDFGTLTMKGGEWTTKINLYSATGQDFYASTRPATLRGADGIIFVIDAQKKFLQDNLRSFNELRLFYQIKFPPIVISMNKMDLPNIIGVCEVEQNFNLSAFQKIEIIQTIATNGKGIHESFKTMMGFIFPTVQIR